MSLEYRIGDVHERLKEIPDGSIDLIVTSPPFLALRSYLPADHPDKGKEIGSEATPAAFIDTLLALTAEFGRVLASHGSLCVELGDTYSHEGAGKPMTHHHGDGYDYEHTKGRTSRKDSAGWPLPKSLTGIPTLYPWSLAYGRNLLTGEPSPAGQWRIRNIIVWARPNPPVGALGDKFRPATSYITVACRGVRRFFDLDAVRTEPVSDHQAGEKTGGVSALDGSTRMGPRTVERVLHPAGAPPLDWHTDDHPEDGDWLWKLATQPYKGAHYATFPLELPTRLIMAMCPLRVCLTCGKPSERIVGEAEYINPRSSRPPALHMRGGKRVSDGANSWRTTPDVEVRGDTASVRNAPTLGWSDCGHNLWRTGVVLDPFAGSGTTLEAAQNVGRHAIGIDLDPRNADLAQQRVGMFLEVT